MDVLYRKAAAAAELWLETGRREIRLPESAAMRRSRPKKPVVLTSTG
jgi:hypothetical protein